MSTGMSLSLSASAAGTGAGSAASMGVPASAEPEPTRAAANSSDRLTAASKRDGLGAKQGGAYAASLPRGWRLVARISAPVTTDAGGRTVPTTAATGSHCV